MPRNCSVPFRSILENNEPLQCSHYTHVWRLWLCINNTNLVYSVPFGAAMRYPSTTWYPFSISLCIFLWTKVRRSCRLKIENGSFVGSPTGGFTCVPRSKRTTGKMLVVYNLVWPQLDIGWPAVQSLRLEGFFPLFCFILFVPRF